MKRTTANSDLMTYLQIGHDAAAKLWIWNGRKIETASGGRTHQQVWGPTVVGMIRGRWDGAKLTIVSANEFMPIVPQWLLDALENEFGTPAEVLVF